MCRIRPLVSIHDRIVHHVRLVVFQGQQVIFEFERGAWASVIGVVRYIDTSSRYNASGYRPRGFELILADVGVGFMKAFVPKWVIPRASVGGDSVEGGCVDLWWKRA